MSETHNTSTGSSTDSSTDDTAYPPPPGYGPPPPGPQPRPPLRRVTGDDKVVAGVAAGVARTLGIDPILIRVAFVVLTIFGGSGILLYLAGWLFIPETGSSRSSGERFIRDNNALMVAAAIVLGVLVLGPFVLWRIWDGGFGFGGLVLLLLAVAGVVALSRRESTQDSSPGTGRGPAIAETAVIGTDPAHGPAAAPSSYPEHPTAVLPAGSSPTPPPPGTPPEQPGGGPDAEPPAPPPPPKDKSVLGRLTLGLALLATGTLVALDVADAISISAVTVIAVGLAVVALGLLVGSLVGRSRGLIAAGICLALVLIPMSAVPDGIRWNTGDGTGDRTYRVKTVADLESEYALGAGSLTLDLRQLDLQAPVTVDASVGVGEVIVMVPPDAATDVSIDVGVGVIDLPAQPEQDGVDITEGWTRPAEETSGTGSLDLTLSAGIGAVTVIDDADGLSSHASGSTHQEATP